jgi:hypothetical protein
MHAVRRMQKAQQVQTGTGRTPDHPHLPAAGKEFVPELSESRSLKRRSFIIPVFRIQFPRHLQK